MSVSVKDLSYEGENNKKILKKILKKKGKIELYW